MILFNHLIQCPNRISHTVTYVIIRIPFSIRNSRSYANNIPLFVNNSPPVVTTLHLCRNQQRLRYILWKIHFFLCRNRAYGWC